VPPFTFIFDSSLFQDSCASFFTLSKSQFFISDSKFFLAPKYSTDEIPTFDKTSSPSLVLKLKTATKLFDFPVGTSSILFPFS
jgi:hypothetical protein